jgi:hypothetical protein
VSQKLAFFQEHNAYAAVHYVSVGLARLFIEFLRWCVGVLGVSGRKKEWGLPAAARTQDVLVAPWGDDRIYLPVSVPPC